MIKQKSLESIYDHENSTFIQLKGRTELVSEIYCKEVSVAETIDS